MKRLLVLAVLALPLASIGQAERASPVKPAIGVAAPLVPTPIDRLARQAVVLEPWRHEDLTIYPVRLPQKPVAPGILTMDEAMKRGVLSISETGRVNDVIAFNRGASPVLLMAGEMIGGARQDRTIKDDVLLAPQGKTRVAVYCVEAHRWAGGPAFKPLNSVISGQVRQSAKATSSQSAVWGAVAEAQQAAGAPSATGAFRSVYESENVRRRVLPYKEKMAPMPSRERDASGVIVVSRGRFIVADIFADRSVFQRLWPKLLDSYAVSTFEPGPGEPITSREDAQRLVRRIAKMMPREREMAGLGRLVRLEGAGMLGSALVWQDAVVHIELFPGGARAVPLDRPMRAPEQRRRLLQESLP